MTYFKELSIFALLLYRVLIKYCVFFNSAVSTSDRSTLWRPKREVRWTHTENEGNDEWGTESGIYFKTFEKPQYLLNTMYNGYYSFWPIY